LDVATEVPLKRPHDDPILEVNGLAITVPSAAGRVEAVQAASFRVSRGEAVGLVGESGSGKTLTCRAVLGVLPPGCEVAKGTIVFDGVDVTGWKSKEWEAIHGSRLGAIFQDPASYLNPSLPVGRQLSEVLRVKAGLSREVARQRALGLLASMGLHRPEHVYHQIPAELSGGMLQRVLIAIAISCNPDDLRMSVLFVSHDLAVVAELCDRIVVFYAGEVVEVGRRDEIISSPRHPYTEALLRVGSLAAREDDLEVIPGQPPAVGELRSGCRFSGRCPYEVDRCSAGPVPLSEVTPGRWARCVRVDELALTGTDS
jgi:peptide/nickel transport system ATP-binding protein